MPVGSEWDSADIEKKLALAQANYDTLDSGYAWETKVITFSFPASAFPGTGSYLPGGEELQYTPFTQNEIDRTIAIFEDIERFLDIDFVYDASGGGEIKIGHQNMDSTIAGYASYPTEGSNHAVVISENNPVDEPGFGLQTLIHELGHSLGLEHPHETQTPLNTTLDIATATIMSYNSLATNVPGYYPLTSFMPMDILALQSIYGVSTKATDDTYTADNMIQTIADYGGFDTIDISTQAYDATDINIVDLRRGYVYYDKENGGWSSLIWDSPVGEWSEWTPRSAANGFYNMIIMPGSTIEKVVGSAVSDRLTGDGRANNMSGGDGNDTIAGGKGADRLSGEAGSDVFLYKTAADSPAKSGKFDLIMDFDRAEGDQIDVSTFDANVTKKGNQAFRFDRQGDGEGGTGQISWWVDNGRTHIYGNTDGDKKAEFHAVLDGEMDLRARDFAL